MKLGLQISRFHWPGGPPHIHKTVLAQWNPGRKSAQELLDQLGELRETSAARSQTVDASDF